MSDQKPQKLRLGTRSSPLALVQANMVKEALVAAHPDLEVEIIPIKSAADWKKQDGETPLSEQKGGKGQFAKEIEKAHMDGLIDCGVHSLKDMACFLPDGLEILHVLPRADARDAFISEKYNSLEDLPEKASVGTCSPRRRALILNKRPDVNVVPFRGNVKTRLDKVKNNQVDATYLAMAGITRLGIHDDAIKAIEIDSYLPACGQGVVCLETKKDDVAVQKLLDAIHCPETMLCASAEREVLKVLDGSCHTPIAAYAVFGDGNIYLRAQVLSLDGQEIYSEEMTKECADVQVAQFIGHELGMKLKEQLPEGFLE